ncbi:unnamed protein product [Calypogeia fissa]
MARACAFLAALIITMSYTRSDASNDNVERTLAMIKPDGVRAKHTDAIKEIIEAEGFKVVAEKDAVFDEAGAQSFYKEHSETSFFPQLVEFMTSGPVRVLVLERQNAIKGWRALMGPTDSNKARLEASNSVRAKFGLDGQNNCVHGSDSPEAAAREIAHFFDAIVPAAEHEAEVMTAAHDEL